MIKEMLWQFPWRTGPGQRITTEQFWNGTRARIHVSEGCSKHITCRRVHHFWFVMKWTRLHIVCYSLYFVYRHSCRQHGVQEVALLLLVTISEQPPSVCTSWSSSSVLSATPCSATLSAPAQVSQGGEQGQLPIRNHPMFLYGNSLCLIELNHVVKLELSKIF